MHSFGGRTRVRGNGWPGAGALPIPGSWAAIPESPDRGRSGYLAGSDEPEPGNRRSTSATAPHRHSCRICTPRWTRMLGQHDRRARHHRHGCGACSGSFCRGSARRSCRLACWSESGCWHRCTRMARSSATHRTDSACRRYCSHSTASEHGGSTRTGDRGAVNWVMVWLLWLLCSGHPGKETQPGVSRWMWSSSDVGSRVCGCPGTNCLLVAGGSPP